jgi:hypothetical protein
VAFFGTDSHYYAVDRQVVLNTCGMAMQTLAFTMDQLREIRDHRLLQFKGNHHNFRPLPMFSFTMNFRTIIGKAWVTKVKQLTLCQGVDITNQELERGRNAANGRKPSLDQAPHCLRRIYSNFIAQKNGQCQ